MRGIGKQIIYLLYGLFSALFVALPSREVFEEVTGREAVTYGHYVELVSIGFGERWWWAIPLVLVGYVVLSLALELWLPSGKPSTRN